MLLFAIGLMACEPDNAAPDLDKTYNARQCIIDIESRNVPEGMYVAENSISTASGAYQWLDSSWPFYLEGAEGYYNLRLTTPEEDLAGARKHAAYASPYTQDLVSTYALVVEPQNVRPWTHPHCYRLIGTSPLLRDDGPVNPITQFIQRQIDAHYGLVPLRSVRPLPPTIEAVI